MNKLLEQVSVAKRRLTLQMFFGYAGWTLLAALTIAAVAVGVHTRYPTRMQPWLFNGIALGAGLIVGLLASGLWTWLKRPSVMAAATELDRRFGLKERVSSSLALAPDEHESPAGQALVADALARLSRVEVGNEFGVPLRRRLLLPLLPLAVALALALTIPAYQSVASAAGAAQLAQQQQVQKSTEELRKKIEERKKHAAEKGLQDAEVALKEFDDGLKQMEKKGSADRQQGLVQLNTLADKLAEKRKNLEGAEKIKQQLREMKETKQGPGDKLTKDLKAGDFKQAAGEMEKLQQQLQDGKLTEEKKQQLADQIEQIQQKLAQQAQAQQQKMDQLKQQLDQARQQGNNAAADQIQQQIDQQAQQSQQADQMQQLSQQLGQTAQSLKQGNSKQAQQSLQQLKQDLSQLQKQSDQLQSLDQSLNDIQLAKQSMTCDKCGGKGCDKCHGDGHQGEGEQGQQGGQQGKGQGGQQGQGGQGKEGEGQGQRDQWGQDGNGPQQNGGQANNGKGGTGWGRGRGHNTAPDGSKNAGYFDTRVQQKVVGPGQAVVSGTADGPNSKGKMRAAIQTEFESQSAGPADPLTNQRLPKSQRTHVEEYFDSLRKGD